jgi:putative colanic acid biosysnthesis UDP-glucose lipid carrier transferase
MASYIPIHSKNLLQRHSSLSCTVQELIDGAAIIGITLALVQYHYEKIGGLTTPYMVMMFALLGVLAIAYDKFAIYRRNAPFVEKAIDLLKAWSLTFIVLVVLAFLTKHSEMYSRYLIGQLFVIGYLTQLMLHIVFGMIHHKIFLNSPQAEKVLIVGLGQLADCLKHKISDNPWIDEQVVGLVRLTGDDTLSSVATSDLKILGNVENLPALIDQYEISKVYIVTQLKDSKALENAYKNILDKHISIHWVPDIFSLRLLNHSVKEISGIPVITLSETPMVGTRLLLKSIEDKVLASIILLAISPILLLVAIAIKLDSPGPVFFRQNRSGWNGAAFKIWKFRSMYVHQEEANNLKQAEKNDSRITGVGAFIRRTSLDELPQIFNVLAGNMSLVGPRPHALQHDDEYSQRIFDYYARHHIKPGITGLAQVRGHRGETKDINQMIQRIESDIEYINNWSIFLDFSIIFRTAFVLAGNRAY